MIENSPSFRKRKKWGGKPVQEGRKREAKKPRSLPTQQLSEKRERGRKDPSTTTRGPIRDLNAKAEEDGELLIFSNLGSDGRRREGGVGGERNSSYSLS